MAKHDYRRRRNGCTQRYLPTDQVEDKVTDHDRNITLDPSRLGRFRQQVTEHIEITRRLNTKEVERRILEIPTGDVVSAHFRFADGTTGSIAALSATPDYARFAVFGSLAWAEALEMQHVDPGGTAHFHVRRRGDTDQTRVDFEPAGPVKAGYEHWADAVAGRADYRFGNADRLGNVAILEALVRSSESGHPEPVAQYA